MENHFQGVILEFILIWRKGLVFYQRSLLVASKGVLLIMALKNEHFLHDFLIFWLSSMS